MKKKVIRACTVSQSLGFVTGMLPELSKRYEVVLLSSPGPEMDAAVARYDVRAVAVPMERHISLKHDLISLWRIVKVFRRERPAMVHSMTPKAGLLCMMAAWLTRVPVRIHTFTGLVFPTATGLKRRILLLTDAMTCWCATHVIPEGEGVKNDLLSNHVTRKPLQVLGFGNVRGIDLELFSHRPEVEAQARLMRRNDLFTFLFVGRIVRDKGMNELMAAFSRLNALRSDTRLLLVGNFEDSLDPVSDLTRQTISSHPCIESLGPRRGDDLIACYAAADCFVFPSYREGFPNTVLEAGAMGLPQIVTDINGSREIISRKADEPVRKGDMEIRANGIVIPFKNEEALYEAMLWILTHKDERQSMASEARGMIASRFEQNFVRHCLYDYYESVMGKA